MPTYRGITVNVVTKDAQRKLEEHGVRHLTRSRTISCYIESETDLCFEIQATPEIPFPLEVDDSTRMKLRRHILSELGWSGGQQREELKALLDISELWTAEKIRECLPDCPPPYHLLISVFLDGRRKPERRSILYLDPEDSEFSLRKHGATIVSSRLVRENNGSYSKYRWVFKESVGIDTLLDKLVLGSGDGGDDVNTSEEDEIIKAMNATVLETDEATEETKLGQIRVSFERVTLGEHTLESSFNPTTEGLETGDIDMSEAGNMSHLTGLTDRHQTSQDPIRCVNFSPFASSRDPPYAEFIFFYRSAKVLRKFGFLQPSPKTTPNGTAAAARQNDYLQNKTPLGLMKLPMSATASESNPRVDSPTRPLVSPSPEARASSSSSFDQTKRDGRHNQEAFRGYRGTGARSSSVSIQIELDDAITPDAGSSPTDDDDMDDLHTTFCIERGSNLAQQSRNPTVAVALAAGKTIRVSPTSSPVRLGKSQLASSEEAFPSAPLKVDSPVDHKPSKTYRNPPSLVAQQLIPTLPGSDADDERDLYGMDDDDEDTEIESLFGKGKEIDENGTSRDEDDPGLREGVRHIALGKRTREEGDEEKPVAEKDTENADKVRRIKTTDAASERSAALSDGEAQKHLTSSITTIREQFDSDEARVTLHLPRRPLNPLHRC